MSKTLVIGDIHGCYDELQHLLDRVGPTTEDTIVHIGDLVDRGPHPSEVVAFFRDTPNAISLLGNRDDKHIMAAEGHLPYSGVRQVTRNQFANHDEYDAAVAYFRTLPTALNHPDALLVHGYYEPNRPLEAQRRDVLIGHRSGYEHLQAGGYDPFYVYHTGEKPLVFGHRPYPFLSYQGRAYAIDTRCVYGGTLTGLLLPDFVLVSVPARDDHWRTVRRRYAHLLG